AQAETKPSFGGARQSQTKTTRRATMVAARTGCIPACILYFKRRGGPTAMAAGLSETLAVLLASHWPAPSTGRTYSRYATIRRAALSVFAAYWPHDRLVVSFSSCVGCADSDGLAHAAACFYLETYLR